MLYIRNHSSEWGILCNAFYILLFLCPPPSLFLSPPRPFFLPLSLIAWGLLCWWWARCSSWWLWQSLSLQEPWLLQSDRPPSSAHPARWLPPGAAVRGQRPALQEGAGDNPRAGLSDLPLLLCWVLLPHDEKIQGGGKLVKCWLLMITAIASVVWVSCGEIFMASVNLCTCYYEN